MENLHLTAIQSNNTLLGILFFGVVAVFLAIYLLSFVIFYFLNNHKKHYIATIRFPQISEDEREKYIFQMRGVFDSIFKRIYSQTDKVFFEILKTGDYITMQIGSNKREILDHVKQSFTQVANTEISDISDDELLSFNRVSIKSIYSSEPFYPINKNMHFFDGVINLLAGLPNDEQAGLQFIFRGVNKKMALHMKIQGIEKRFKSEKRLLPTNS